MADRRLDNGRDDARTQRTVPSNGTGAVHDTDVSTRSAEEAPPGSRERAESNISGYAPERDEEYAQRQGRFHRAAAMRMAQPRTSTEGPSNPRELGYGGPPAGPYGQDDRDDRSATGTGRGPRMGQQDVRYSLELRRDPGEENYRPWDRTGYGGEQGRLREDRGQYSSPQGLAYGTPHPDAPSSYAGPSGAQGQPSTGRYDPLLGMGQASPGRPGAGVNVGGWTPSAAGQPTAGRRWHREPLTAREIMTRGVKTLRRDSSLREVAQLMKDEDCGAVPIVDGTNALIGIVTDRDLVIRAFTGHKSPEQLRAGDVMTDDVECVHPDEDLFSIIAMMGKRQIRRIPVVDRDDHLIGIISLGDIAHRADYDEEVQEALERISSRRSFWKRLF
ncbi:CBS domain-containing protein [Stigmatella aurantiaca]|uniref:CBS domain protein n=1 Tax=Stigmatella aurantiaca (strain DW4/3-1) TaxID=378806 RepID=E3FQ98_STIAD|nr:CBS domain-containing protein [Stigmatella aurantiaca]ADO68208.1 CBS domain protein [Stigmatella aurantiaca DW4/3-1]